MNISLYPSIQSLLVLIVNSGTKSLNFESAAFYAMLPRIEFLMNRGMRQNAYRFIEPETIIDKTIRPALLLPPPTIITFKDMLLCKDSTFRCALGSVGVPGTPVVVELTATDRNGKKHSVFRDILTADHVGWKEIDVDLSSFSGEQMTFILASHTYETISAPPLVCCGSPVISNKNDPGLNLIIISIDTLRQDHLGCYGYLRPVSPVIDNLAKEGILFERAYAQAPYTLPSHVSLFTSLYPSAHGVEDHQDRIHEGVDLLAEILAESGWECASFNNGGFVSHIFGLNRGFDLYCEIDPLGDMFLKGQPLWSNQYADGSHGSLNRALNWISQRKNSNFFIFLHTFMVHEYLPPKELADEFNAGCKSHLEPGDTSLFRDIKKSLSKDDLEFFVNMYDASIRASDDMIARLLNRLRKDGTLDRTLLVITSDHGEEFQEHGATGHGRTVYEELIRIPLIMRIPGVCGGIRVPFVVNQVDIMPTILDLLGIEDSPRMQGRTLVPLLNGVAGSNRTVFSEVDWNCKSRCIMKDGWKYIESIKAQTESCELFEIAKDRYEKRDQINDAPNKKKELMIRMKRLLEDLERINRSFGPQPNLQQETSEKLIRVLKQQGYL